MGQMQHQAGLARLDARAKLVGFFALVAVAVTTPPSHFTSFAGYAIALGALLLGLGTPRKPFLRRVGAIMFVVFLAAAPIPFLHPGPDTVLAFGPLGLSRVGLLVFWGAMAKATVGVACAVLLTATTPFPDLLEGLERLHAPRVAVALLGFVYRFFFLLADEATRMKRARDARGYQGRWLWQAQVVGHMIGTLFLRAHERAERVYAAMASRGFDGCWPAGPMVALRTADYAFVAAVAGGALLARVALR